MGVGVVGVVFMQVVWGDGVAVVVLSFICWRRYDCTIF